MTKKHIVVILILVLIISLFILFTIIPKGKVEFYKMDNSSGDIQVMISESIFEERWHVSGEDAIAIRLEPWQYQNVYILYRVKNKMPFSTIGHVEADNINYKYLKELGVVGYMTKQAYGVFIPPKTDNVIDIKLIIREGSDLENIKKNISFNVIANTSWNTKRRINVCTY